MQGRSLSGRWRRVEPPTASRYVHAEAGYATEERWQKIVRDEHLKLIYAPYAADQRHIGGRRQPFALFDLVNDPGETENLIEDLPDDFQRLHDELKGWWQPASFDLFTDADSESMPPLAEETRRQLESLGYLQ
jgi:hypothetical protein